jgi:hypothetical protein
VSREVRTKKNDIYCQVEMTLPEFPAPTLILYPPLMEVGNHEQQPPNKNGKKKDGREWTTPEEKLYLLSRKEEYCLLRRNNQTTQTEWITDEYGRFFSKFPTKPLTTEDQTKFTTIEDKKKFEKRVSNSRLDEVIKTDLWMLTEGQIVV